MYQAMNYTFFSDVDDSKDTWSVVGKVLRKWVVRRKAAPYAVWKVGMLLADEKVLENDDKYRITTTPWKFNFHNHTYIEEGDVVISNEAYNLKTIPRNSTRQYYGHLSNAFNATLVTLNPDIPEAVSLKERLSQESVGSQLFSQISNVDYPTYSSESLLTFRTRIPLCDISKLDQECDIVTKVTIQKCETLYGWMYDACPCDKKPEYQSNGSLRCTKCDKDVLMTVPKYKVHYKVYDDTGKCSVIFFDRHATELLGQSASKIKEAMQKEETTRDGRGISASEQTVCTESQDNVIEDDDNTLSQLITPPEANTKRKTLGNDIPVVCEDLGLVELSTPKMSSTKPMKNIKKEK
ncbi:hypothetical protein K1719_001586 [Acacia pycnantha]|nr:hypothetical protein K1719_001586 [Acacia pycnantha]